MVEDGYVYIYISYITPVILGIHSRQIWGVGFNPEKTLHLARKHRSCRSSHVLNSS